MSMLKMHILHLNRDKLIFLLPLAIPILLILLVLNNQDLYSFTANDRHTLQPAMLVDFVPFEPPDTSWAQNTEIILYVNNQHPQASDSNTGTDPEQPLKTINAAAQLADANEQATQILIHPGVYRESIILAREREHPIVFQAVESGSVIISGADQWDGWTSTEDEMFYRHDWPYAWGFIQDPFPGAPQPIQPAGTRREMVFVDNRLMQQVLSVEELAQPGTFYVDEANNFIYLHPPTETIIEKAIVEVAVRNRLFDGRRAFVALIGLVFTQANSPICEEFDDQGQCLVSGTAVQMGSDALIQNVSVEWNNWNGILLGSNSTIQGSKFNHNGGNGLEGSHLRNVLLEDNESSFNNWRGAMGEFYSWGVGQKIFRARDVIIRRHRSLNNQSPGLWLDWDNSNVSIEESIFCGNVQAGIMLEASHGPFNIKNNVVCDTTLLPNSEIDVNGGILISDAQYVNLSGNRIYNNEGAQIAVVSWQRSVPDTHDPTITHENTTIYTVYDQNYIISHDGDQRVIGHWMSDDIFKTYQDTLISDQNVWYNPTNPQAFYYQSAVHDFAEWQADMQTDAESAFRAPLPDEMNH